MSHTFQQMCASRNCIAIALAVLATVLIQPASAQFETVYNLPPDEPPASIGTNTRLNVLHGGELPSSLDFPFEAGSQDGSSTNVLVEVLGGTVGSFFIANGGSEVNIADGIVGPGFNALRGSVVNISGGIVGPAFSAFDSTVNITGGTVSDSFTAGINSEINISDGSIGDDFLTNAGSLVNMTGGTVGIGFIAEGGTVNILGGQVGSLFDALDGSEVNVAGGDIVNFFDANEGSTVNFSGGSLGDFFDALAGSNVNVYGTQFELDGVDITDSLTPNEAFPINDRNVTFSGVLSDGTPFELELNDEREFGSDFISDEAMLSANLVVAALLGDYNRNGIVDAPDYNVWRDTFASVEFLNADGNKNGIVDAADYNIWRDGFGTVAGTTVPESTTLALFVVAALWLVVRRR